MQDVADMARSRSRQLPGAQDNETSRKMMYIAGAALAVLVSVKLGFYRHVLP